MRRWADALRRGAGVGRERAARGARAMLADMRLLATDLDGTLVFHHVVGQADAEALVRWRAAGNLLVLATGRSV
ncbi:HAD hydrolase family protein, partial [Actinomyces oris]|uniref:HAD hydrolase family protein n=1 Tax=Actinomyces oris TaxID=544580 RepID=UPI00351C62AA